MTKYLNQLILLSRIRKFETLADKIIEIMLISYDIEKDGLYLKGLKRGIAEGIAEGKARGKVEGKIEGKLEGKLEGKAEEKLEFVYRCHANGLPVELAAHLTDLPVAEVAKIYAELDKN